MLYLVAILSNNVWADKIFWGDGNWGNVNYIKSCNLDGSGYENVANISNAWTANIFINEINDKIYWLDDTSRKIQRANPDGTGIEDVLINLGEDPRGIDILIQQEKYGGGNGEEETPYQIWTAE
ncbi:MAG: hypothetical protein JW860_06880 [Sedimentisphaerales bacterium]|nr:hypothetical protein [Sedimentisphaerales bacterium]